MIILTTALLWMASMGALSSPTDTLDECLHDNLGGASLVDASCANTGDKKSNINSSINKNNKGNNDDSRIVSFKKWFENQGGMFHEAIEIGDYGRGLQLAVTYNSNNNDDNANSDSNSNSNNSDVILHHLDPLLSIPTKLILSATTLMEHYSDMIFDLHHRVLHALGMMDWMFMGRGEQEALIALFLMVQDCQHREYHEYQQHGEQGGDGSPLFDGQDSFWGPYLEVLPSTILPRLDTFGEEEYAALNDDMLDDTGRRSKRLMEQWWQGWQGDASTATDAGSEDGLKPLLRDILSGTIRNYQRHPNDRHWNPANGTTASPKPAFQPTPPASCLEFHTFHKFHTIVSSRSFLWDGNAHLAPMADFIPHDAKKDCKNKRGHFEIPSELYRVHTHHHEQQVQQITVRSDRNVILRESSSIPTAVPLVQDYKLKTSAEYLYRHGFVPHDHQERCVDLPFDFLFPEFVKAMKDWKEMQENEENVEHGSNNDEKEPSVEEYLEASMKEHNIRGPMSKFILKSLPGLMDAPYLSHGTGGNGATSGVIHNLEMIVRTMVVMNLAPHYLTVDQFAGSEPWLNHVCIRQDLSIDGELEWKQKVISEVIALASLIVSEPNDPEGADAPQELDAHQDEAPWSTIQSQYNITHTNLRQKCIDEIIVPPIFQARAIAEQSDFRERIYSFCIKYPGHGLVVDWRLREGAKRKLSDKLGRVDGKSSESNDFNVSSALISLKNQIQDAESKKNPKIASALSLRRNEMMFLSAIVVAENQPQDEAEGTASSSGTMSTMELDEKVSMFRKFLLELNFPMDMMELQVVRNDDLEENTISEGARIGVFASQDLNPQEILLSVPANATLSSTFALNPENHNIETFSSLRLLHLLQKYSNTTSSDIEVLTLYLLHERFNLSTKSKWWPYFALLPTIQQLSTPSSPHFHPLFLKQQEIDSHLAGSGAAVVLYDVHHTLMGMHDRFVRDGDVLEVLGEDVASNHDYMMWAAVVILSRSVAIGGKSYIVPVLDMIKNEGSDKATIELLNQTPEYYGDDVGEDGDNTDSTDNEGAYDGSHPQEQGQDVIRVVLSTDTPLPRGSELSIDYAIPNDIMYAHHGRIVPPTDHQQSENQCTIIPGASILSTAKDQSFCLGGEEFHAETIEQIKILFREQGGQMFNVNSFLVDFLKKRVKRLEDTLSNWSAPFSNSELTPSRITMHTLLQEDLTHLQSTLQTHILPHSDPEDLEPLNMEKIAKSHMRPMVQRATERAKEQKSQRFKNKATNEMHDMKKQMEEALKMQEDMKAQMGFPSNSLPRVPSKGNSDGGRDNLSGRNNWNAHEDVIGGLPSLFDMPDMPKIDINAMGGPGMPNMGGMGGPGMPGMPNMGGMGGPGMPNMGGMGGPGMPNMGGMGGPGMPHRGGAAMPNMEGMGSMAGMGPGGVPQMNGQFMKEQNDMMFAVFKDHGLAAEMTFDEALEKLEHLHAESDKDEDVDNFDAQFGIADPEKVGLQMLEELQIMMVIQNGMEGQDPITMAKNQIRVNRATGMEVDDEEEFISEMTNMMQKMGMGGGLGGMPDFSTMTGMMQNTGGAVPDMNSMMKLMQSNGELSDGMPDMSSITTMMQNNEGGMPDMSSIMKMIQSKGMPDMSSLMNMVSSEEMPDMNSVMKMMQSQGMPDMSSIISIMQNNEGGMPDVSSIMSMMHNTEGGMPDMNSLINMMKNKPDDPHISRNEGRTEDEDQKTKSPQNPAGSDNSLIKSIFQVPKSDKMEETKKKLLQEINMMKRNDLEKGNSDTTTTEERASDMMKMIAKVMGGESSDGGFDMNAMMEGTAALMQVLGISEETLIAKSQELRQEEVKES